MAQKTPKASAASASAVCMYVTPAPVPSGFSRNRHVNRTAVAPQLQPSFQASRWARSHAPDSPVCTVRYQWNPSTPSGDSATATSDHHWRWRQIAITAATTHAATTPMALGRVAVASAAASPANSHCSRSRNSRHAAAHTMSTGSA